MTAKELRIGNIISANGVDVVVTISVIAQRKDFEPIPLTEEWLLNFGFKKDGSEFSIYEYRYTVYLSNKNYFYLCDNKKVLTIMYNVHQLQNLYFALTGEELEIKCTT